MKYSFHKFFLAIFVVFSLIIFSSRQVGAVDLTVTCANDGPCNTSPSSGAALFSETNWLPGDSVNRTITVINEDTDDTCNLTLETNNETQSPSDFATRLFTVIKEGVTDLFGVRSGSSAATNDKNLNDLYVSAPISLGSINPSTTEIFGWAVTFDPSSGNEYQNAQTVFDFDLVFTCDGVSSTPGPTPGLTPAGPPPPSGGSGGGEVLGVTTQTLRNLFAPILGTAEEEISDSLPSPSPEVKGEDSSDQSPCGDYFPWWIPLLVQMILTVLYFVYVMARNRENPLFRRFVITPLIFAIGSQIAHIIIGCPCVLTVWCKWYWAFNLIILLVTILGYRFILAKREKTS